MITDARHLWHDMENGFGSNSHLVKCFEATIVFTSTLFSSVSVVLFVFLWRDFQQISKRSSQWGKKAKKKKHNSSHILQYKIGCILNHHGRSIPVFNSSQLFFFFLPSPPVKNPFAQSLYVCKNMQQWQLVQLLCTW